MSKAKPPGAKLAFPLTFSEYENYFQKTGGKLGKRGMFSENETKTRKTGSVFRDPKPNSET